MKQILILVLTFFVIGLNAQTLEIYSKSGDEGFRLIENKTDTAFVQKLSYNTEYRKYVTPKEFGLYLVNYWGGRETNTYVVDSITVDGVGYANMYLLTNRLDVIFSSFSNGGGAGDSLNIYNSDGTLLANRTVTMGGNDLNFSGGNVGINEPIPSYGLVVASTTGPSTAEIKGLSANDAVLRFSEGYTPHGYIGWDNSESIFKINGQSGFSTYSNITIDANGRTGIGTTSYPYSHQFNVGGSSLMQSIFPSTSLIYDLGSSSLKYGEGHITSVYTNEIDGGGTEIALNDDIHSDGARVLGQPSDAPVYQGSSYYFDGVDDQISHTLLQLDSDFSINFRLKFSKIGGLNINIVTSYSTTDFIWFRSTGNNTDVKIANTTYNISHSQLVDNTWYDISFVRDNGELSMFIDGIPQADTETTTGTYSQTHIGIRSGGTFPFGGQISDLQIFNYAFSQDRIEEMYRGASTPYSEVGASQTPVIEYTFDTDLEGMGITSGDETGSFTWEVDHASLVVSSSGTQGNRPSIYCANSEITGVHNKRVRLSFNYTVNSGTCILYQVNIGTSTTPNITLSGTGTYNYEGIYTRSDGRFYLYFDGRNEFDVDIDNITITQIGEVLSLTENSAGTLKFYDQSGNGLDGTITGASLVNPTYKFYGEMAIDSNAVAEASSTQYVWSTVTAATWVSDELNGITFADDSLTVQKDGRYLVTCNASTSSSGTNNTWKLGISINDQDPDGKHVISRKYSSSDVGASGLSAILDLNAGDGIKLKWQQSNASGQTLTVQYANFSITEL